MTIAKCYSLSLKTTAQLRVLGLGFVVFFDMVINSKMFQSDDETISASDYEIRSFTSRVDFAGNLKNLFLPISPRVAAIRKHIV